MKKILASLFACALVGVAAIRYADAAPNERERKGAGSKQPARASGTSKPSTGAKQPARAASGAKAPAKPQSARAASSAKGSARAASGAKSQPARAASSSKPQSARAASTGRPQSARAASTGGARRAASTGGSRRAASVGARRAANIRRAAAIGGGGRGDNRNANALIEVVATNPCPLARVVAKTVKEDDLKEVFKKDKNNECDQPNNTKEEKWTQGKRVADKELTKPTWVQAEEAVYFICIDGYLQGKQTLTADDGSSYKVDVCVNAQTFCPIGEAIARVQAQTADEVAKDTQTSNSRRRRAEPAPAPAAPAVVLKNPQNDMVCVPPPRAVMRKIAGSAVAVMLECPAGSYSDVIENSGMGESHIQCKSCPEGKTSLKGSYSADSCFVQCPESQVNNPARPDECLACDPNADYNETSRACVCKPGYSGVGIGAAGCVQCPAGSYCSGGAAIAACDPNFNQYSDAPGATECKYCPPDAGASEGTTCSCVRPTRRFDPIAGTCSPAG